jgi:hypothetical protein
MNINWIISRLECKTNENGLSNVVYKIHWKCVATQTSNEIIYSSEIGGPLEISSPDPNNFTVYESLTKEQIISWITGTLGTQGTQEVYDYLQNGLNEQINPSIVSLEPPFEN